MQVDVHAHMRSPIGAHLPADSLMQCCRAAGYMHPSMGHLAAQMLNSMGLGGTATKLQDAMVRPAGPYGEHFTIPRRLRLGVSVSSRGELSTDMRLTLSTGCICLPCTSRVVSTQGHAAPIPPTSLSISTSQSLCFARWTRWGAQLTCPISGSSPCEGACIGEGLFSSIPSMLLRTFFNPYKLLRQHSNMAS